MDKKNKISGVTLFLKTIRNIFLVIFSSILPDSLALIVTLITVVIVILFFVSLLITYIINLFVAFDSDIAIALLLLFFWILLYLTNKLIHFTFKRTIIGRWSMCIISLAILAIEVSIIYL